MIRFDNSEIKSYYTEDGFLKAKVILARAGVFPYHEKDGIIREQKGEIFKKLGNKLHELDWEVSWNNLFNLSQIEQSDIDLKNAQTDKIYLESGVLTQNEIRTKRFPEFEILTEEND